MCGVRYDQIPQAASFSISGSPNIKEVVVVVTPLGTVCRRGHGATNSSRVVYSYSYSYNINIKKSGF